MFTFIMVKLQGWTCDCCNKFILSVNKCSINDKFNLLCNRCYKFVYYIINENDFYTNKENRIKQFDTLRTNYKLYTFKDIQSFSKAQERSYYRFIHHFDVYSCGQFFNTIIEKESKLQVIEMGGAHGKLANILTNIFDDYIETWTNYELFERIVEDNHPKYKQVILDKFLWNYNVDKCSNVFVSTHAIEHINFDEFKRLIDHLSFIKYMYFEIPITNEGHSWMGDFSSHIMIKGWTDILQYMKDKNYTVLKYTDTCYGFIKN